MHRKFKRDGDQPPAKRLRAFFIENLIGTGSRVEIEEEGPEQHHHQRRYVLQTASSKQYNQKFKTLTVQSTFLIEHLPANPEELLRRLFSHCIDEALSDARHKGIRPDRLGATISSPLLDSDIWIGVREITPNTADALLNRFLLVSQSRPKSLFGEAFSVKVTAINRAALAEQDELRGGGNQGRRKKLHKIHHLVNRGALLLVDCPPGLCLFYALELTRRHNTNQDRTPQRFHNYLYRSKKQQLIDVQALMRAVDIPFGHTSYDAKKYVPPVVDHWNRIYAAEGKRFKVFIFGEMGSYKPEDKYGPDNFTHPISLYYSCKHFDGIRCNVGSAIFGRDKYCFSCECPYDRAIDHISSCKGKCTECGRIGAGALAGACTPDAQNPAFNQHCAECNKTFCNEACWLHHKKSNYCRNSKRCPECSKVYNVRKLNGKPHDCMKCYCRRCFRWHAKDENCYITPLKQQPQRPYRLVIYDFECTQDAPVMSVDGSPSNRFEHEVNFVAMLVMCPACIASGEWRNTLIDRPPCPVCGPYRTVTFSHHKFTRTKVDHNPECADPLYNFIGWLLDEFDPKYDTVCYAHNAGRYDTVLTYKQFFQRNLMPDIVRKGNKIFELRVPSRNGRRGETRRKTWIKMRDSLNMLPVSLERLVGAFGLQVDGKEFFPHAFNTTQNYENKLVGRLPPKEDYFYNSFPPEKKKRFEQWWAAHQHLGFDLVEALPAYCVSDVRILAEALVAFRQEWLEVSTRCEDGNDNDDDCVNEGETVARDIEEQLMEMGVQEAHHQNDVEALFEMIGDGKEEEEEALDDGGARADCNISSNMNNSSNKYHGMDVLAEASTISSACIRYFRMRYLKEKHVVLLSNRPIDSANNQSSLAMKYLEWYAEAYGCQIQTAFSPGGEKRFGPYTVDGWCEKKRQIIEVNGCIWHACKRCFPDAETVMPSGKTAGRIRSDDRRRLAYLEQCADRVDVHWECEIREQMARYPDMREAFSVYHDRGPINVRDAFMGGRVDCERMIFECPEGWEITYADCNSMYPHEMLTGSFPVSAPKVHVMDHPRCIVDWTRSEQLPFKGILKVFIETPDRSDIPILPAKFDARLCFSLCRTCALRFPSGGRMPDYSCPHTDEQRGWLCTLPHIELAAALDSGEGWRITRFYRGLEFDRFDSGFFAPFVRDFMSMKIHSSGFPDGVAGQREEEDRFIQECWDRFGIRVHRDKMHPNKARRECSKLILNNIWAKFSQNPGLCKTKVTDSPAELRRLLDDRKIDVSAVDELSPDCVMITYKPIEELEEPQHCYHNPVISLWCTSLGRLHLLEKLRMVKRDPNSKLLYYDTDSCIVAHKVGQCPIPTGHHLGEWKNELPEYRVVAFLSGGCKNYALRCIHRQTGEEKHILHVRGISLTADVCERLHWETFKRSVLRYMARAEERDSVDDDADERSEEGEASEQILIDYPRALRPSVKHSAVYTVPFQKRYRPIITKGVVTRGGIVRPFGFRG